MRYEHVPPPPNGSPYRHELRVAGYLLQEANGGCVPDALRYGVDDVLRRLYAQAQLRGAPYRRGVVDAWRLELVPDLGDPLGHHLLTLDARISELPYPITAERMERDITALLSVRRTEESM